MLVSSFFCVIFQVEACLDSFQYEEAVDLCVRAVELEPDSMKVLEEAGPVLLELGHTDKALKVSNDDAMRGTYRRNVLIV